MKIGICHTKSGSNANRLFNALDDGFRCHGDETIRIGDVESYQRLKKDIDVTIQLCWFNRTQNSRDLRFYLYKDKTIPHLVLDVGFLKHTKEVEKVSKAYWTIGLNGIKRGAEYFNKDSPPDRFEALNVEILPWRESGKFVLIMGQNEIGFSAQEDIAKWIRVCKRHLIAWSSRPLFFRPHPNQQQQYGIKYKNSPDIRDDLKKCWATVCHTTNACVESVLCGVPVITNNKLSMVYNISSHKTPHIESPVLCPDRLQWASNLAYAQWNMGEMRNGLMWDFWRDKI